MVKPWGSILIRLTPKSFCTRLLTVAFNAALRMAFDVSELNADWDWFSCADSSEVCPNASSPMMSEVGSGGSER